MTHKKSSAIPLLPLKGSALFTIWQKVLATIVFAIIVIIFFHYEFTGLSQPSFASLIPGIVLGFLLVFRTNTAYERFGEGRRMVGGIIDVVRTLSRQLWVAIPVTSKLEQEEKYCATQLAPT